MLKKNIKNLFRENKQAEMSKKEERLLDAQLFANYHIFTKDLDKMSLSDIEKFIEKN